MPHIEPKDLNLYDFNDTDGHGTHVAGLILKNTCQEVKIKSCRFYSNEYKDHNISFLNCLIYAISLKPDVINISAGGIDPIPGEFKIFKTLEKLGIPIFTAAGNRGKDLKQFPYYPASYNISNMIVVGNLLPSGERNFSSNYGLKVTEWEMGTNVSSSIPNNKYDFYTGTSQATAIATNKWLLKKCEEIHKNVLSK